MVESRSALFVLEKDVDRNVLFVGQGENHPGLLRHALRIQSDEAHWIHQTGGLAIGESTDEFEVRIRYRQPLQKATLTRHSDYRSDIRASTIGRRGWSICRMVRWNTVLNLA